MPALPSTRSGWPLLRTVLSSQRRGLLLGVFAGLLWGAGKVAVPTLTRLAIDHGIIGHESLWFWSAMIAVAAVVIGTFTGWRRWLAFNESRLDRDPPARPAVRALHGACTRASTTAPRPAS